MPHLIASGKTGSGRILRATTICWLVCLVVLAGCKEDAADVPPLTRVKVVTTEIVDFAPPITLTGVIAAQVRTDLSFRLSGKISERLVNVGDHVVPNQVLARLDPDEQQAELVSAQAGVASAEAMVRQATGRLRAPEGSAGARQHHAPRLRPGRGRRCARPRRSSTRRSSDLSVAQDQLAYTELRADADGIIVARMAEAGQVVAQAQPVYILARDGAARRGVQRP